MIRRNPLKNSNGFTLFEVLVYVALFSIIITASLAASYQIIGSTVDTRRRVITEQEANFVFRKIDWALNGDVTINFPSPGSYGSELDITRGGTNVEFRVSSGRLLLDSDEILSGAIGISNFVVHHVGPSGTVPPAVEVSFVLNGRQFATTTRYVR